MSYLNRLPPLTTKTHSRLKRPGLAKRKTNDGVRMKPWERIGRPGRPGRLNDLDNELGLMLEEGTLTLAEAKALGLEETRAKLGSCKSCGDIPIAVAESGPVEELGGSCRAPAYESGPQETEHTPKSSEGKTKEETPPSDDKGTEGEQSALFEVPEQSRAWGASSNQSCLELDSDTAVFPGGSHFLALQRSRPDLFERKARTIGFTSTITVFARDTTIGSLRKIEERVDLKKRLLEQKKMFAQKQAAFVEAHERRQSKVNMLREERRRRRVEKRSRLRNASAVKIQSQIRRVLAQKFVRQTREERINAVQQIQKGIRDSLECRAARKILEQKKEEREKERQAYERVLREQELERQRILAQQVKENAAVGVQRIFRGREARKQVQELKAIQKAKRREAKRREQAKRASMRLRPPPLSEEEKEAQIEKLRQQRRERLSQSESKKRSSHKKSKKNSKR